ncbi:hypothetical protein [Moorena sp. SIO4G3]|uniref:hypothetical protein n=1 Tax=Moorena sp. SIO4G3 TaxID=2607821 RepID=UPI00142916C8|nr:hypothetical protein [Moorena sp. SIO4G3]NEO79943.1 hypothetical protein [Moorena sp. SIO4G3]
MTRLLAVVGNREQRIWEQWTRIDANTIIKPKHSAISYQLSAISYQLSAISYQLSAISYQLSAYGLRAIGFSPDFQFYSKLTADR